MSPDAATKTPAELFDLTGRAALLTGAGRGIGLAMARALAAAGSAVAIQDLDRDVAEREAAAINRAGRGRAVAFGGDVSDLTLPARLVADAVAALGGLHILVNNASVQTRQPWLEVPPDEIERQFRADLVSPVLFCQQVVPIFRGQKFGRIVNLGSVQQRKATLDMFPYSLTKGALEKMTIGLARTLAGDGITINQIAPGWITNTQRNKDDFKTPEEAADAGRRAIPAGRLGDPTDFAGVVLLICSDAGAYMTGQNIFVDGGMGS